MGDHSNALPEAFLYDPETGLITYSCNPEHVWDRSIEFEVTNAGQTIFTEEFLISC